MKKLKYCKWLLQAVFGGALFGLGLKISMLTLKDILPLIDLFDSSILISAAIFLFALCINDYKNYR